MKHRNMSLNQTLNCNLTAQQSADCDVACGLVTLDSPEIRQQWSETARQTTTLSFF